MKWLSSTWPPPFGTYRPSRRRWPAGARCRCPARRRVARSACPGFAGCDYVFSRKLTAFAQMKRQLDEPLAVSVIGCCTTCAGLSRPGSKARHSARSHGTTARPSGRVEGWRRRCLPAIRFRGRATGRVGELDRSPGETDRRHGGHRREAVMVKPGERSWSQALQERLEEAAAKPSSSLSEGMEAQGARDRGRAARRGEVVRPRDRARHRGGARRRCARRHCSAAGLACGSA